jgi:hypothetical protein
MISDAIRNVAVPQEHSEALEAGLLRGGYEAEAARCCPIGLQEACQIPSTPEGAPQQGEKPGEAMTPVMQERLETKEHIDQQGCPYLPAHGIGAVAQEISQLQGLLDLLEEGFDGPAAAVEVGDAGGAPLQVVGEEDQFLFTSVDFDQCGDAAHQFGVMVKGGCMAQGNDLVAQDATNGRQGVNHLADHVILGAGDPEDATLEKIEEMSEVQISLVEYDNLTGTNAGAEFAGAFGVVLPRRVDDGEAGQKAVEVEPQMALGGRFAPPVLGPVHTGGDQCNRGGIDHMNDAPETPGDSLAAFAAGKAGLESLQMAERRPENPFRQTGVPLLVGVREIIAAWRRRGTEGNQQTAVQTQPVADVVEPDGVRELRVDQADEVAPGAEGARFPVHTGFLRQFRNQMRWNQIANLPQDRKLTAAWNGCFFHPCRVAGQTGFSKPFSLPAMGWL